MEPNSVHTKDKIFSTALRLFADNGYEKVSVRAIADAVGIKVSSIYNHYKNKEQILEACYKFYSDNHNLTRLSKEQYEPILKNGSKYEVMEIFNYQFHESLSENLVLSLFVIYSRIYTDEKACEIYVNEINTSIQYIEELFMTGIEVGRFNEFNIQPFALMILSSRMFAAQCATIKPELKGKWQGIELDAYSELVNYLPFKY